MSSPNDDGATAQPEGMLSGAGIAVEYLPGQDADTCGLVVPGLSVVDLDSAKPQGYSIGASSLADGGGGGQDGEIGEPVWVRGPLPGWEMSNIVDLDGDTFSPQGLQQMKQGLSGLAFEPFPSVPMPANQPSWIAAATKQMVKRTIKPTLNLCTCGSPYALQDIQTSMTDMTHLNVLLRCTGCKKKTTISFQPQGDEQVGPSYDAVAISYFKKAEEGSDDEAT